MSGTGDDSGKRLAADASGNVIVIGHFSSTTIAFDTSSFTNAGTGTEDVFLSKYTSAGDRLWTHSAGGTGNDYGFAISTNAMNETFVAGFFYSSNITFGTTTLLNNNVSGSTADCFLTKLGSTPPCFASYTTTYDSTYNEFNILVDSITATTAVSYLWDFGDGATSTLSNPSHTYLTDSVYNVCMFIQNIYGDSCSFCHLIGIDTAGNIIRTGGFTINIHLPTLSNISIHSNLETNTIIYPNPSTGIFKIASDNSFSSVEVIDMMGKEILKLETPDKQVNELDLSNQPNGIYIVKLHSKNKTITKRISIIK